MHHDRGATKIKSQPHFPQSCAAHRFPHPGLLLRVQKQKAPAARAHNAIRARLTATARAVTQLANPATTSTPTISDASSAANPTHPATPE